MEYQDLREEVWLANIGLVKAGLVTLTWGNASGCDRKKGIVAIKPSGMPYDALRPDDIVVLDLETGRVVDGNLEPSTDTPTHLQLYRTWPDIGGIVHTHSRYASAFAQARRSIPCLGTTQADTFHGGVPVTRPLTRGEINEEYERNTGRVIVEALNAGRYQPLEMPAVLVQQHGPFTWGATPTEALENAIVLEAVAAMALDTLAINQSAEPLDETLLETHYRRKHGPGAYYGQRE